MSEAEIKLDIVVLFSLYLRRHVQLIIL